MLVSEYLSFIADLRELTGAERALAIDAAVAATGLPTVFYRPIGEPALEIAAQEPGIVLEEILA